MADGPVQDMHTFRKKRGFSEGEFENILKCGDLNPLSYIYNILIFATVVISLLTNLEINGLHWKERKMGEYLSITRNLQAYNELAVIIVQVFEIAP
jgi:hypothetical protein